MGIEERPFAGTWRLNQRKTVQHTPDAIVYVNGDTAIPGCPACGGRIDIQPYLTGVSVDPSVEGPATATLSLHVPRHTGDSLYRDGNFLLRPGLEVHIYLRGYFPVKGLVSQSPSETGGADLRRSVMYPYYLVFHGVVTDVGHEYSGGEHTVSLSCSDLLHFWQFQRISQNGSAFGARPTNSKVRMSLVGHNFTGMSPYSIIYQLYRDVMGAAGGVEFALGSESNVAANSTVVGESLFSLSILYWQKRFSQSTTNLRMYGVDGTLYNGFQQAFLASLKSDDLSAVTAFADSSNQSQESDPLVLAAALTGFDPNSLFAGAEKASGAKVNVAQLQGFVTDISNWGNVELFESVYQTKMEVANTIKEVTGFEFYQDVDGDMVFKPPFYNLDTSANRVYRIEDIDIISFSASEKEPEATVVKSTGSWMKNVKGVGLDGWVGTRAQFIDYRLVAQFGWRESTFETSYHTNPAAMYAACIARFDLFNIGVKSASCTIPIRPELRPGYPVYIVPFDCFYYLHSFSHGFNFGGQCTTTLSLVGKRSKFFAPGRPPLDGRKPNIDDIQLGNPHLPTLPLEIVGDDDIPRLQGFPNVVMTLDPEQVNPLTFARGISIESLKTEADIQSLLDQALAARSPVLQRREDDVTDADEAAHARQGPFQIQVGNGGFVPLPDVRELLAQVQKVGTLTALNAAKKKSDKETADALGALKESLAPLTALIEAVRDVHAKAFPDANSSAGYLELLGDLKASFNPGASLPGYYRYFSSAHPNPEAQGPRAISVDPSTGVVSTGALFSPDATADQTATGFVKTAADGNALVPNIRVQSGIPLVQSSGDVKVTPTHQITMFSYARFETIRDGSRYVTVGDRANGFPRAPLSEAFNTALLSQLNQFMAGPGTPVTAFAEVFESSASRVRAQAKTEESGVPLTLPYADKTLGDLAGDGLIGQLATLAQGMADALAVAASAALLARQTAADIGGPGAETDAALARAWAACWPGASSPQTSGGGKNRKSQATTNVEEHVVPVFPVSDERGYEVVGTYRYGRGMNIEDSLDAVAGFTSSTSNVNYDEVEAFLEEIRAGTDVSKAVGTLSVESRAKLAASLGGDGALQDVLDGNLSGLSLTKGMGSNRPANANQSTQKVSIINAAYGLADLGAQSRRTKVCSCKGAEADMLVMAFDPTLFAEATVGIEVGETEAINEWLTDQNVAVASGWSAVQAAYRGTAMTRGGDAPLRAAGDLRNLLTGESAAANRALGEVRSRAAETEDAAAALGADLAAVPEAALDDIDAAISFFNTRRE